MAKAPKEAKKPDYPSEFGSHKVMVVEVDTIPAEDMTKIVANTTPFIDGEVFLKDEHGYYKTCPKKLDDRSADPNRYAEWRLEKLFVKKKEKT